MTTAVDTMTESGRLAEFALGLVLEDVPPAVVEKAKDHLLDALGIAIASSRFDFGKIALQAARELGEGSKASAIGSGVRLPAASAALVNGILAHGLDFDDTHIGGIYHASAPALAAVLPSAQANGSTGSEALVAFIIAMEAGIRLGIAGSPEFHERGFHPTAICGTFAAAAAAGRLYGLDQQQLGFAIGLCGSQAAGILEIGDSWLKRMHPGWAAHSGIVATMLGRAGFRGPATAIEGHRGLYGSHLQHVPGKELLPMNKLGSTWHALDTALKPYPCCHFLHAFVDAALELRSTFALDDVERIEAPLSSRLHPLVAEPRAISTAPKTTYQALFSLPYTVALALIRGEVNLAAYYDEPLDSPEILALAGKIFPTVDPESDFPAHFPGELIVHLRNGSIVRVRKATSLGTADRPLARTAIAEKFKTNATRAISSAAAENLIRAVDAIEDAPSLDAILAMTVAS